MNENPCPHFPSSTLPFLQSSIPSPSRFIIPLLIGLMLLGLFAWPIYDVTAQVPGPQQVGLVIVYGDGTATTRCIDLPAEGFITGADLLKKAEIPLVFQANQNGTALCKIQDTGCPADDCFCQCKGTPCQYWSYFHLKKDNTWEYATQGSADAVLHGGDVDAWVWGDGKTEPMPIGLANPCLTNEIEDTPGGGVTVPVTNPTAVVIPTLAVIPMGTVSKTYPYQIQVPIEAAKRDRNPIPRTWRPYLNFAALVVVVGVIVAWQLNKRKTDQSTAHPKTKSSGKKGSR